MNRFALRTTSILMDALRGFLKVNTRMHGFKNLPEGPVILVINHFTRFETFLLPYFINKEIKKHVWSLADAELFVGKFGDYLHSLGAVSTEDPERDKFIIKTLLEGEAPWIIFPESRMVKSQKVFEKGKIVISSPHGKHRPRTGAATLALRAEFYRQRLLSLDKQHPEEAKRLLDLFGLDAINSVSNTGTVIVPVNISYYPIRARENFLNRLAEKFVDEVPERVTEELMIEGAMLFCGVDIDIRFGKPIKIKDYFSKEIIRDITTSKKINFDDPIPSREVMKRIARKLTDRYMKTIYHLVTVNHDHLFASILRHYPFKRIREKDFRRRAFLIFMNNLSSTGAHIHEKLKNSQIKLLTDGSHEAYNDFLTVAQNKKIISRDGEYLIINKQQLKKDQDFHRIRLYNPIKVMANTVEPLTKLQHYIWRNSILPRFLLKDKIVDHLLSKAERDYRNDYEHFYVLGESKPLSTGQPYLLSGAPVKKIGILLIHGYMASPLEVSGLAGYLNTKGLWVYAPRLAGHGTSPDDLATRTYHDWVESVEEGYALINSLCERVIIGGFSTGAGLALDLAVRVDESAGVFAVCPPLKLQNIFSKFIPLVNTWNKIMDKTGGKSIRKEFVDNDPENPHINYFRNPISGVRELGLLMNSLEPKLKDINIPALVVQSNEDPVVNPEGSRELYMKLGTNRKEYLMVDSSRHGILLGDNSRRVHKAIWEFIKHIK